MKKTLILLGIFLLLSVSYAQQPPTPPSSASLQTLISSLQDVKQQVGELKRDMHEFKQQLNLKLEKQQQTMLLFLAIFNIGYLFLLTIFHRILSWVIWKRRSREVLRHEKAVITNLKDIDIKITALMSTLDDLKKKIPPSSLKAEEKKERYNLFSLLNALKIIILLILTLLVIYLKWQIQ